MRSCENERYERKERNRHLMSNAQCLMPIFWKGGMEE
jgi:hypothetical protein